MNLVFAAGFLMPQQLGTVDYFRGAKQAFPNALFPPVPIVGDIVTRATDLAKEIDAAFRTGPIHIVAHSMAGLDSRYLLSHNLFGLATPGRVATLSTISTPHHGTPVADLLAGPTPSILDPRRFAYDVLDHLLAELGVSCGAIGDLTPLFAANFNKTNHDVAHVKYFSYAGSGMESFLLKPSHVFMETVGHTTDDQSNDGLVPVRSAAWRPLAEPSWPTDHFGEVGYNLSSPTFEASFDHLGAYRRIVERATAGA